LNAPSRVPDDRMRAADPGQRARQIDRHLIRPIRLIRLIRLIRPICPIRLIRLID
jgi:hypothetical protein